MSDDTWLRGWVCPKCNGVFAPLQRFCPDCNSQSRAFFVIPDELSLSPVQMRELQDALNAVAQSLQWEHKLIVLPPKARIVSEHNV